MISIRHAAFAPLANLSLYVVVLFSMWSAVAYFVRFWRMVDTNIKHRRRRELLTADRLRQTCSVCGEAKRDARAPPG